MGTLLAATNCYESNSWSLISLFSFGDNKFFKKTRCIDQ